MTKFINRPENVVDEMLQGFAVLSEAVARLSGHKVTCERQVAIISGNGSGYEPAHAG